MSRGDMHSGDEIESDGTSSYRSHDDDDDDTAQAKLIALLNAQCAATLGGVGNSSSNIPILPVASTSRLDKSDDDEEEDEHEEWTGLEEDTLSTNKKDDAEGVKKVPQIISFSDSNTLFGGKKRKLRPEDGDSNDPDDDAVRHALAFGDHKDNFMSSKIRRVNTAADEANKKRNKGKGRANDEDEAEEKHLKELDASLYSLIRELPSNANVDAATSSALLSKLASSTPPPSSSSATAKGPRLLTRKSQENEKEIDKRAPRTLREKIYAARLERAKIADSHAKESGIVTAAGKGKYALTKKARREQTGVEDARRKNAKGITGVVGKMRKGGAVLSLNREEIRRGNEGDMEGLARRKHKGGPKNVQQQHHGKSGRR